MASLLRLVGLLPLLIVAFGQPAKPPSFGDYPVTVLLQIAGGGMLVERTWSDLRSDAEDCVDELSARRARKVPCLFKPWSAVPLSPD